MYTYNRRKIQKISTFPPHQSDCTENCETILLINNLEEIKMIFIAIYLSYTLWDVILQAMSESVINRMEKVNLRK